MFDSKKIREALDKANQPSKAATFRVILVDDEPHNTSTLLEMLDMEFSSAHIIVCNTAQDALSQLQTDMTFLVAIIDYKLERGISGIDVAREFRKAGVTSVLLTGAQHPAEHFSQEDGGFTYEVNETLVYKPFDRETLINIINDLLAQG